MDLEQFKIQDIPATAYYIPSFITEQEEQFILQQIENTPRPKWTQLSNRRLINYGGVPHKNGMIVENMPKWLQQQVKAINSLGAFEDKLANHVLVNEYLPNQGIMPHTDGPLFYPVISTISCGSHTVLQFHKDNEGATESAPDAMNCNGREALCRLLLEPRSLIILSDELYRNYLHSIEEVSQDTIDSSLANLDRCAQFKGSIGCTVQRDRRISLTIRHVPKTSKFNLRLGH